MVLHAIGAIRDVMFQLHLLKEASAVGWPPVSDFGVDEHQKNGMGHPWTATVTSHAGKVESKEDTMRG